MSFQPIRRILPKAIQEAGILHQVTAARVVEEATQTLKQLWGAERAVYVQVISFSDGTLKLRSSSGAAIQELKSMEIAFQNELNRRLGSRIIKNLSYVIY
ncbi:DUF721 domain-containing protein [Candidatus Uhrbacteria bacterium]|nr:DUF721 domain-containing protein [Candidatus Uhrbacteria bacterium]